MSIEGPGDQKIQDDIHPYRGRIPQRMMPGRQKTPTGKTKPANYSDVVHVRPKSASRAKDDGQLLNCSMRSARSEREKLLPVPRKSAAIARKCNDNILATVNKVGKQVITVPIAGKQKQFGASTRAAYTIRNFSTLPDQETINKCENLETQQDDHQDSSQTLFHSERDLNGGESITSRSDKISNLRLHWQEKMAQFEKMKNDLSSRQRTLLELYATLRVTHQKLSALGQKSNLPPADDLQIMNVAKMTADQLLQMCAESKQQRNEYQLLAKNSLNIDINKLNNMPMKLIDTCEQTLIKRKEVIDWFEALKNQEKGLSINILTKKINEFNAENEMLNCTLQNVKADFLKDLNEIFDFLRKCVNETVTLQVKTDELTCALSEQNSKNIDLKKQIYNADQCRSQNNKSRIEELEKQLREERLKKSTIRDRLSKAEGQVKIGEERAIQLEAALNQSRSHTRILERTIQQLNEQNQRLQLEFDKELSKLNESIKENTTHLEEIADAREKLQSEKEDLEKRLEELSNHYNESLDNIKQEQNRNVTKIIEIEKEYHEEIEERKKRDTQIESLCAKLVETELRYKDTATLLQDQKSLLRKVSTCEQELEDLKDMLNKSNAISEEYKDSLSKQNESIKILEKNLSESQSSEAKLKCEMSKKEEIIAELNNKQNKLEEQLRNSDYKMKQYEEQLTSLKNRIAVLQEHWDEMKNFDGLPEIVNEQNSKLMEITCQNNDLRETLQQKCMELDQHANALREQENIIKDKDIIIKELAEKEKAKENIIVLLKSNIEMRAHVDFEVNQQLVEKSAEVGSLLNNLETRKQQIDQLEKIVLTLEDQMRKITLQKKSDEDKINKLEKQLAQQHESYYSEYNKVAENPAENLDNLIKVLEEELNSTFEPHFTGNRNYHMDDQNCYTIPQQPQNEIVSSRDSKPSDYYKKRETVPAKIVMGNFVKKTYIPNKMKHDEILECKIERNLQNCIRDPVNAPSRYLLHGENFKNMNPLMQSDEKRNETRNLQYIVANQLREEKKLKMFKLAGHRI